MVRRLDFLFVIGPRPSATGGGNAGKNVVHFIPRHIAVCGAILLQERPRVSDVAVREAQRNSNLLLRPLRELLLERLHGAARGLPETQQQQRELLRLDIRKHLLL
ncbi:hypothetical protein ABL78_8317 [Leptomonas seymouri]|uniref:Uncharacterized protein n=1 Tax=Leptomonas seymouri TaxID=5684 RepID=A0A0N1PBR5_LEPSE|nr:hypothetical protein ABL78_8317 [Leptomonas seymouri]|eukprot:KPI82670.1 hypothetical protein ABL78_8317 [Leptomonas seymouri]